MNRHLPLWMLLATLALAACSRAAPEDAPAPAAPPPTPVVAVTPAVPAFDIASVAVSEQPLGAFPYFEPPDDYRHVRGRRLTVDAGRFPFWIGDRFEWVEGRVHRTAVIAADGARFSDFGLMQHLEAAVTNAGGVRVAAGAVPAAALDALWRDAPRSVREAQGDLRNGQVTTWVLRRSDRDLWLHVGSARNGAAVVLAETAPTAAADLAATENAAATTAADAAGTTE